MAEKQEDPEYLLAHVGPEVERLTKQHNWIQKCLGGQIIFAPIDIKLENLRVLDVGCANGRQYALVPSPDLPYLPPIPGVSLFFSFFIFVFEIKGMVNPPASCPESV